MNRAVVIGGSGFIGSHTADALSAAGYKVTIYDTSAAPWHKPEHEMIVGDVLDPTALERAMRGARYVYHFAGIADIGQAAEKPYETIQINVMGAAATLEAAVAAKVERFVYASTMYVYSPFGSFYRATKQAAEVLIEAYSEKYGLAYTIVRYGSLYGPRAQDWNGLRRYVKQIVQEGRLDYPGDGHEVREYIHVEDAARLSVEVLGPEHANSAVMLTGTQSTTSAEIIDMIFEIAGVKRNVRFTSAARDHYATTAYRYSPKRATKLVPSRFVDLGQGILDIIEEIHAETHRT